jgi:hypothetical protein
MKAEEHCDSNLSDSTISDNDTFDSLHIASGVRTGDDVKVDGWLQVRNGKNTNFPLRKGRKTEGEERLRPGRRMLT